MAAFVKFHCLCEDLAEGKHDFSSDTLKIFLSNTAPNVATHTRYDGTTGTTGPAEIASGNGYSAGGVTATVTSSSQTAGLYKLVLGDVTFTATGGSIPATGAGLRYAVLYNSSAPNDELIGYWDYGATITLLDTETMTVDFDPTTGALTIGDCP